MIYKSLIQTIFICGLFLTACGGDDDDLNPGSNVVIVESNIETPTTWYGDSVYLIEKYDFYVDALLTIKPGTVIKFHPEYGPYMMIGGLGVINATGTASKPIVFTSYFDDSHGGDSNEDGHGTNPAPKDWGEINTNGHNGSVFRYCDFLYGGSVLYNATITLFGNNNVVEDCRFISNDGGIDFVGVLDASYAGSGTIIRNNIFYGNKRPLTISTHFDLDNSNTFHNPDNASVKNQMNGICVYMTDEITTSVSWAETEVAFVLDGYQRYIDTGGSLTLADNVVIKFMDGGELWLEEGAGQLINHSGTGVAFTSYNDDSRKGDTNGDGNATQPYEEDWLGIFDNSLSIPYPYFYTWGNIFYDSF